MIQYQKAVEFLQRQYEHRHNLSIFTDGIREVRNIANGFAQGGLIHLSGLPGCGLTSFLHKLSGECVQEAVTIEFNFSCGRLTLLDQFADTLRMRSSLESLKSIPTYIHECVKYIGLKIVIVDDLDRFMITPDYSLAEELIAISQCGDGLVVLFTTQSLILSRHIKRLATDNTREYFLDSRIEIYEAYEVAENFCIAANLQTQQAITFDPLGLSEAVCWPVQINQLVRNLERSYISATLDGSDKLKLTMQYEDGNEIWEMLGC